MRVVLTHQFPQRCLIIEVSYQPEEEWLDFFTLQSIQDMGLHYWFLLKVGEHRVELGEFLDRISANLEARESANETIARLKEILQTSKAQMPSPPRP